MKIVFTSGDERAELFNHFCNLIDICDSFDQLGKLAVILDKLYSPQTIEHKPLFDMMEMTARHLKTKRDIGANEKGHCKGCIGVCDLCDGVGHS